MGRIHRVDIGGHFYHVLNRANARLPLFKKEKDYKSFEKIIEEAKNKFSMPIMTYCLMPNHWHLILNPLKDGDLNKFMQWLTLTHTQRWHSHYHTTGSGHLYQGRYKSFLIQDDKYFLTACKYVEGNAFRSKLVGKAQDWPWSSLWRREFGNNEQKELISPWPEMPNEYLQLVNRPQNEDELQCIRESINKSKPFGDESWQENIIGRFGLEMTIRSPGRPKKGT